MENEKEKYRADIMIVRLRTPLFSIAHYLSHAHRYGHRTHAPTQPTSARCVAVKRASP
jgi:hypothetical protein